MDRLGQWWTQPTTPPTPQPNPYQMGQLVAALPGRGRPRRGRGRGRGRGRRPQVARSGGQPSSGVQTRSGDLFVARGTEVLGPVTGELQVLEFNPSCDGLPRLAAVEKMYHRYRIKYVNIAFKSGSGTATAGNVAFGVCVGPKVANVKTQSDIMKLRPFSYVPAWKNSSITVGSDIDIGRFMISGSKSEDGVAFTLYIFASAAQLGVIQISYEVEFSHPTPF